ncbi:hypothetical protein Pmani_004791 [Petrolisthes manimaculis]|uniref:Uncharacterized protein n=1 Tax=Petrolisthes manimaculis TaxID=1843537 RepID=A0AAE1QE51_9EUCA|nr:hypothetical protein Pmani_004791 [Petrolisthes manimaculis]
MAGKVGAGVSPERELHTLVLLRLSASAFYVYQQLSSADKKDYDKIKAALTSAFAVDKFVAFDQFVIHKLHEDESDSIHHNHRAAVVLIAVLCRACNHPNHCTCDCLTRVAGAEEGVAVYTVSFVVDQATLPLHGNGSGVVVPAPASSPD